MIEGMTMWDAMKITALGDFGWALAGLGLWLFWKLFFAKR